MSRVMAGVKGGIGRGFAASLVPHVTCKHVRVICAARQLRLASLPRRHLGTCDGKCREARSGSMLAVSGDQSAQVHAYRSVSSPSHRAERREVERKSRLKASSLRSRCSRAHGKRWVAAQRSWQGVTGVSCCPRAQQMLPHLAIHGGLDGQISIDFGPLGRRHRNLLF